MTATLFHYGWTGILGFIVILLVYKFHRPFEVALWVYFMRKSGKVGQRTINQLWREAIAAKSGQDFLIALTESINNKGNNSTSDNAPADPAPAPPKPAPRKHTASTTTSNKANTPANPTPSAKPAAPAKATSTTRPNPQPQTDPEPAPEAEPVVVVPPQTRGRHAKPDDKPVPEAAGRHARA